MGYTCVVCYYDGLYDPPYDVRGIASDEICPCCGFQFGFDDDGFTGQTEKCHAWREKWIANGNKWFSQGRKIPDGCNLEEQLKGDRMP
jgi:hypothetical protein